MFMPSWSVLKVKIFFKFLFFISGLEGKEPVAIISLSYSTKKHSFVSKFFGKITMPKDIRLAIDVDPIDIL